MSRNYYTSGQWNLICDVCGKKIKSGKSRHRWDGFVVCEDDWEERHPQDFVKARQDKISVPFTRPRPPDAFKLLLPISDYVFPVDTDESMGYVQNNASYFLEDYLELRKAIDIIVNWNRSTADTINVTEDMIRVNNRGFVDTTTVADTIVIGSVFRHNQDDLVTAEDEGSVFLGDYIEPSYFEDFYVGTYILF